MLEPRTSEKWDRLLDNWLRWRIGDAAEQAPISSAYKGELHGATGYRSRPLLSDALLVDDLMTRLHQSRQTRHIYAALYVWTQGKGTRGHQAATLSIGVRTLYARVDAGKALLEHMHRNNPHRRKSMTSLQTCPTIRAGCGSVSEET